MLGLNGTRLRSLTVVSSSPIGDIAKMVLMKKIKVKRDSLSVRVGAERNRKPSLGRDSYQPSIVSFSVGKNGSSEMMRMT